MRILMCLLTVLIITVGCEFHRERVMTYNGTAIYSSLDPRKGIVRFLGRQDIVTEADVWIDGAPLGTLHAPVSVGALLERTGSHILLARIYMRQRGVRGEYLGCFRKEFQVDALNRRSPTWSFWWEESIGTPSRGC